MSATVIDRPVRWLKNLSFQTPNTESFTLTSLPHELLAHIAEQLCASELDETTWLSDFETRASTVKDLFHLSLANTALNRVAAQALYGLIVINRLSQLEALNRSLEAHPQLGALVRAMKIDLSDATISAWWTKKHADQVQYVLACCGPSLRRLKLRFRYGSWDLNGPEIMLRHSLNALTLLEELTVCEKFPHWQWTGSATVCIMTSHPIRLVKHLRKLSSVVSHLVIIMNGAFLPPPTANNDNPDGSSNNDSIRALDSEPGYFEILRWINEQRKLESIVVAGSCHPLFDYLELSRDTRDITEGKAWPMIAARSFEVSFDGGDQSWKQWLNNGFCHREREGAFSQGIPGPKKPKAAST